MNIPYKKRNFVVNNNENIPQNLSLKNTVKPVLKGHPSGQRKNL